VFALGNFILANFYLDIGEKESLSVQQSQLKEEQGTELQKEKDEVTRLKEEVAELKHRHELVVQKLSDSCKAEVAKTQKEVEDKRAKEASEIERRLNVKLEEQKDMFKVPDELWDAIRGKLRPWKPR
jgi:hypothetical protein